MCVCVCVCARARVHVYNGSCVLQKIKQNRFKQNSVKHDFNIY